MGGCRCTFRDCNVSTTKNPGMHFFHFPLKERERFQKWLDLCKTHDMLELPLNKQRNRVICARHFRDECFMNYKKKRLVNSALPTLMRLNKTQAIDYEKDIHDGVLVTLTASRMPHLIPPSDFKCPLDMDSVDESLNIKLTEVNSIYTPSINEKYVALDRQKHSEQNSSNMKRKSASHNDGAVQKYKIVHNKEDPADTFVKSTENMDDIFLSDANGDETLLSLNDILSEDTIDAIEGLSNNSYETDGGYKEEEIANATIESTQIMEVNRLESKERKREYSKSKSKTKTIITKPDELTEDNETKCESLDYSKEMWLSSQRHTEKSNSSIEEEISQITYETKLENECKQYDNNIKALPSSANSNSSKYPLNIVLAVRRDLQAKNTLIEKSKTDNSNLTQKLNGTDITISNMESKCKEHECQYITLKKKYNDLMAKYSQLEQKFNELEEQHVATVSTSHEAKITTATITYTAATLSKAQLFNSIKRYLNAAMISLLRIEMFGNADRQWKSDERHVAADLLNLGEPVYKHFTDEWRFHLPSIRIVRDWLNHSIDVDVDDNEDI